MKRRTSLLWENGHARLDQIIVRIKNRTKVLRRISRSHHRFTRVAFGSPIRTLGRTVGVDHGDLAKAQRTYARALYAEDSIYFLFDMESLDVHCLRIRGKRG